MTLSEKTTAVLWAKNSGGDIHSVGGVNHDVNTDTVAAADVNDLIRNTVKEV